MFNLNRETWKWKVQATEVTSEICARTSWGFQLSRTKLEEFFYHWEKRRKHCFILAIILKKLVVFQKVVNSYTKCSYDNTRYLEASCPKKSYKTVRMVQVKNKARCKLYMAFCFLVAHLVVTVDWWPFLYHMKMADWEYFCDVHFLIKQIGRNSENCIEHVDSWIDKPCGCPKRAVLPDVHINKGAQSINTERASFNDKTKCKKSTVKGIKVTQSNL